MLVSSRERERWPQYSGAKMGMESCRYMYCSYAFQQMGKFSNYLSLRFDFYLTPTKHFHFLNQIYLKTFIP